MNTVRHIRIFLASPGDVLSERRLAFKVIERLADRPWARNRVKVETIAWDRASGPAMVATLTPQEAITRGLPKPSMCDVVVTILWSRFGTPLPPEYVKPDGTPYASGTEWEFLDAVNGAKTRDGRPVVLLYRRTQHPTYFPGDPDYVAHGEQWNRVEAFIASFRGPGGWLRGGVNEYALPSEFEEALETHLEQILYTDILGLDTGDGTAAAAGDSANEAADAIRWEGSPYPGLVAFERAQAAIFFGRGRDVDRLFERVQDTRAGFLAVIGTSGSGKSSLVRAGLLPRIDTVQPGGWKVMTFTPDELGTRDPFASMAAALLDYDPGVRRADLGASLAAIPGQLADLLERSLGDAGPGGFPRALVFVDQFEEVFTTVAEPHREPLIRALVACAKRDRIQVIVTLRSDFYTHAVAQEALIEVLEQGTVPLGPAGVGALLEMIEEPAKLAGIRIEPGLAVRIISDTGTEPGALALMAYTLSELYRRGGDARELTIADYEALGGVTGALATRSEAIFAALDDDAREALPRVVRELIEVDERGTATRLRAPLERFEGDAAARRLCAKFTDERLFVSGEGMDGRPYVEVAHEAILRRWDRLVDWIDAHGEDLRLWRRVSQAAREWDAHGRASYYLWPYERLAGAIQAQSRLAITVEDPILLDFIRPEWQRLLDELGEEVPPFRRSAILLRMSEIGEPALPAAIRALAHVDPDGLDVAVREMMRSLADPTRHLAAQLLASPRGDERLAGARALLVLGDEESVDRVAAYMRSTPVADDDEPAGLSAVDVRVKLAETARQDPAFASVLAAAIDDPSPRVRDGAIQNMRWTRGAGFAVAWKAALTHQSPAIRDLAFRILRERNPADAIPALVEVLRSGAPEDREQAEAVMAGLQSDAAPGLTEALSADGGAERVVLVRALARIGDASADAVFVKLFDDADPAVRGAAVDGVRRLSRSSWERFADCESLARRLDDVSPVVKASAALALAAFNHRDSIHRIVAMLEEAEPVVRAAAAESVGLLAVASRDQGIAAAADWLGHVLDEGHDAVRAAADRLGPLLDEGHEAVRAAAALALGRLGHEPSIPLITALLGDASARARAAAAAAFEHLQPAPLDRLTHVLTDTEPAVVAAALRALGTAGHALAGGYGRFLERSEPAIRGAAAFAAGRVGEAAATPGLVRMLGAERENREAAAAALREIGARAAVPPLVALMDDADEDVRGRAVSILGDLGDRTLVRRLLPRLSDSDWHVRSAASGALRKLADRSSVPELIAALNATSDPGVRSEVADLLGNLGDPSAIPHLERVLDENPDWAGVRAAAALGRLIDDVSSPVLDTLVQNEQPRIRRTGIEILQRLNGPDAGVRIAAFLTDPAPDVRTAAAAALGTVEAHDRAGGLLAALDDPDVDVRNAAIASLASLEATAAVGRIARLAGDSEAPNRAVATRALGKVGSETEVVLLLSLLDEGGDDIRQAALEALAGIASRLNLAPATTEAAIARIRPLLGEPEGPVWTEAAAALVALSDTATVLMLLPSLTDESGPHRWRIEQALSGIRIDEPSDELHGLLAHQSAAVRAAAIRLFAPAGRAELLPRLLEAGLDPDWSVKGAALGAFESYDTAEAVAWLSDRAKGAPPETRAFIVQALERTGRPEAREILLELAADASEDVAGAAIRALPSCSDAGSIPIILGHAAARPFGVRWSAVDALTRLRSDDLVGDLLDALPLAGPDGKALLVGALLKLAEGDWFPGSLSDPNVRLDPRAEKAILARVDDADDTVADAVAEALRRADPRVAVPALFRIAASSSGSPRYTAGRSLERHAKRDPRAVFPVIETLGEAERAAAADWLADLDHPAATEALERLAGDPDANIRRNAIRGLARKTGTTREAVAARFAPVPEPGAPPPAQPRPSPPSLLVRVLDAIRGR